MSVVTRLNGDAEILSHYLTSQITYSRPSVAGGILVTDGIK